MNARGTQVYLLCSRRPIVAEFCLLAETLSARGYKPVLVVPNGLWHLLPKPLPTGAGLIGTNSQAWRQAGMIPLTAYVAYALVRRLGRLARQLGLQLAADFLDTSEAIARGRSFARRILKLGSDGAAVLTADDRDIRVDQGVLSEAARLGILTLSVAFGKSDVATDTFRRAAPAYQLANGPWKSLKSSIASRYPQGVRSDENGRQVLFFRPGEYLALRRYGLLFPAPWSYGGGTADKVSATDEAAAATMQQLGVPTGKIVITGQCSHDTLWRVGQDRQRIRGQLDEKYGFLPSQPLVLVALPPLSEHGLTDDKFQQSETSFLFEAMARLNGKNVLVSLHPRQQAAAYQALASRFGLTIATEALREILPAAHLFVAYSSTISWAQLLGIPSVALEYYGFGYTLFANEPGVESALTRESLHSLCETCLRDDKARHSMEQAMAQMPARSLFDGEACMRLIHQIEEAQR
jgi:hypothetical protein